MEQKRLTLRIEEDLHAQVEHIAAENRRSFNDQVLWMIETYITLRNKHGEARIEELKTSDRCD